MTASSFNRLMSSTHPAELELIADALEEFAADAPRCGVEQPPLDVFFLDSEVEHRGADAPSELVDVIFQADQQHPTAQEHALAREWAPRRGRAPALCEAPSCPCDRPATMIKSAGKGRCRAASRAVPETISRLMKKSLTFCRAVIP